MSFWSKLFKGSASQRIMEDVQAGELIRVEALLKRHRGLASVKDDDGRTPMHFAAANGHKEIAALLLAKKADVNAKDSNGSTPLHDAAFFDRLLVAELLLNHNAEIEAEDNDGMTPYHRAIVRESIYVASLLLQRGCSQPANVQAKITLAPLLLVKADALYKKIIRRVDSGGMTPNDQPDVFVCIDLLDRLITVDAGRGGVTHYWRGMLLLVATGFENGGNYMDKAEEDFRRAIEIAGPTSHRLAEFRHMLNQVRAFRAKQGN